MDKTDKIFLYSVLLVVIAWLLVVARDHFPSYRNAQILTERIERAINKNQELSQLGMHIQAKILSHDIRKFSYQEYLNLVAQVLDIQTMLMGEDLKKIQDHIALTRN